MVAFNFGSTLGRTLIYGMFDTPGCVYIERNAYGYNQPTCKKQSSKEDEKR